MAKTNFVIAHGAWTGGWSWEKVAALVRKNGDDLYAPTLSGLCERSHLAKFDIDLKTHIDDVVNEIKWKDLKNVVLIGHSYGGIVATGVAEEIGKDLSGFVFLDAFVPDDGMSFSDFDPNWKQKGPLVPVPDFGNSTDEDSKATPQPIKTMTQKLKVTGKYHVIPKKTYIICTGWEGPFAQFAERFKKDPSWLIQKIDSGHDAPNEKPEALAALLLQRYSTLKN